MKPKLIAIISVLAAIPALAHAAKGSDRIITSDKMKTQAYCDLKIKRDESSTSRSGSPEFAQSASRYYRPLTCIALKNSLRTYKNRSENAL